MNDYLIYFNNKYNGDWDKIYYALKTVEHIEKNVLINFISEYSKKFSKYFTILDEDYPKEFNILKKPPFVIHYKGNINLLKLKTKLNITGNYEPNYIDKYFELIKELPNDCVIVSNYWQELDNKIVSFCIENQKKLIIVLPCGLSIDKFQALENYLNSNNILIISEYPDNYGITKKTLLARNRIISALSNSLIILASKDKTLYGIINSFLNIGKEIYCFASETNDSMNDNISLINFGAKQINNFNLPLASYDTLIDIHEDSDDSE